MQNIYAETAAAAEAAGKKGTFFLPAPNTMAAPTTLVNKIFAFNIAASKNDNNNKNNRRAKVD